MISFENPKMLLFMAIIPLITIIHFISLSYFSRKAQKFANFETLKRIHNRKKIFSKKLPQLFLRLLFVTILILAAASPSIWIQKEGFTEDVIFALDVSGSMLADDLQPNRLEATKEALVSFFKESTTTPNAGVISFTSTAYPEINPTQNKEEIIKSLQDIQIRKSSGTSLGQAINYGTAFFEKDLEREKKIIIFTDGQENVLTDEELKSVVQNSDNKNINTYIIGVGTSEGGNIGNMTGKSIIREEAFELITEEGGGDYTIALNKEEIKAAVEEFINTKVKEVKINISFWLYISAFVLLMIEWYFANYLFRSFP